LHQQRPADAGGITVTDGALEIESSNISHSTAGKAVDCSGGGSVTWGCSEVHRNAGGDYVDCLSGLLGVGHNISADPDYCDRVNGDLRLEEGSPRDHPVCGVMSAEPVGCAK
jgi:hypothetical protein